MSKKVNRGFANLPVAGYDGKIFRAKTEKYKTTIHINSRSHVFFTPSLQLTSLKLKP